MEFKILEFILNSIERLKHGFLLSSICMFPESNGTKFWFYSFHLQNSGISQTRMNFDNFQIKKMNITNS